MKTSPAGIEFIKRQESILPYVYIDRVGVLTFGWGHAVRKGEYGWIPPEVVAREFAAQKARQAAAPVSQWGSLRWRGAPVSEELAAKHLSQDLARVEVPLTTICSGAATAQHQFDAMVSLFFNVGVGWIRRSKLVRAHLAGDFKAAAAEFLDFNKAGGKVDADLTRRRRLESAMYQGVPLVA